MKTYLAAIFLSVMMFFSFPAVSASAGGYPTTFHITSDTSLVDQTGNNLEEAIAGSIMLIKSHITSTMDKNQTFIHFFQIKDEHGITASLSWMTGRMLPHENFDIATSWLPEKAGSYTIETFTWELQVPNALGPKNTLSLEIKPSPSDIAITFEGLKNQYQVGETIEFNAKIKGQGSACVEFRATLYKLDQHGNKANQVGNAGLVPGCKSGTPRHEYEMLLPIFWAGENARFTANSTGAYLAEVTFKDLIFASEETATQQIFVTDIVKTVKIGKSKEITITNSDSSTGLTFHKALLTLENVSVYSGQVEYVEFKHGFITLNFTYTIKNTDRNPYFATLEFEALAQGDRYPTQTVAGTSGSVMLPHENRSGWFTIQVVEDATKVTLVVIDPFPSKKTIWTVAVDLNQ